MFPAERAPCSLFNLQEDGSSPPAASEVPVRATDHVIIHSCNTPDMYDLNNLLTKYINVSKVLKSMYDESVFGGRFGQRMTSSNTRLPVEFCPILLPTVSFTPLIKATKLSWPHQKVFVSRRTFLRPEKSFSESIWSQKVVGHFLQIALSSPHFPREPSYFCDVLSLLTSFIHS